MAVDPFYKVKDDVTKNLATLEKQVEQWVTALTKNDTIQIAAIAAALEDAEDNVEANIEDLDMTIQIASQDPRRFNIDERELQSRRTFVEKAKKRLADIRTDKDKQKAQVEKNSRRKPKNAVQDQIERENDEFIGNEIQRQDQIYKDQDEDFERLRETVGRLGEIGKVMKDELDEQNVMLDEVNEEAEDVQGMLGQANKGIQNLIKAAKKSGLTWAIIILFIILILLVFISFSV